MKKIFFIFILTLLSAFSLRAQSTEGTDFWLSFGLNSSTATVTYINLQIRIASGSKPTTVNIKFTNLGISHTINIGAFQIYDYTLNETEKEAAYIGSYTGLYNRTIHITSNHLITVYALNQNTINTTWSDVTNVLPATTFGLNYRLISYHASGDGANSFIAIAMEDDTQVYFNPTPNNLNAGDVLCFGNPLQLTGRQLSANKPIAFFAHNGGARVPEAYEYRSPLVQQLPPVNLWGKRFFVPPSHLNKDRVRIVAWKDNTNITQKGGVIKSSSGSQMSLNNLQSGQFVELEIYIDSLGCYIHADKPVGVCTFLTGASYNDLGIASPAQCWIPAIEQKVTESLVVPFKYAAYPTLNVHHALVITPTGTEDNTRVSIGATPPTALSGGIWIRNEASGMSYYRMPLFNDEAAYRFINSAGLIVLCYGVGERDSYYYLGGSAMRDLDAAFYANDIHFQDLKEKPFCEGLVNFRAEINGLHPTAADKIRWFIDGTEEPGTLNQETWNKTFTPGEYEIKMVVHFENDEIATKIGTLTIISCNQSAEFFANNIPSGELSNQTICNKTGKVDFRAEIEGIHPDAGSLKWYVNDELQPTATNQLTWSKDFATGAYEIKMWVRYDNGTEETITATLKVEIFWIKMQNVRH